MSVLDQQVGRAQGRLTTNVFFERAAWGVLLAAAAWAVVVVVERLFVFGIPLWACLAAAAGLAAVFAVVGTALARPQPLRAALAIDSAAGLKERVSTALTCRRDADPFAQAAVHDAEQTVARVHVPTHLPLRAPRLWSWAAAAVGAAAILAAFMPKLDLLADEGQAEQQELMRAATEERTNITVAVNERLSKIKELVENDPGLKELAKDLKPLDMPDTPTQTPDDVRRDAVKQLDKVTERLKDLKTSDKLAELEKMQRMLAKLDPQEGSDATARLSNGLAAGDFESAKKAVADLKKELEDAAKSGDPQARQQLAELQKRLDTLSAQLSNVSASKELEKDLEKRANLTPEQAKKLLENLSKMDPKQLQKELQRQLAEKGVSEEEVKKLAEKIAANQKACQNCKGLGKALKDAAQALQQGDQAGDAGAQAAAAALDNAMEQMSELELAQQMLDELEVNLSELQDLQEGVCKGGFGQSPPKAGDEVGGQGPQYGLGYGSRIGKERRAHQFKASKAGKVEHPGVMIGQRLVDGPQVRGEALAEEREAVNAAVRDATDAIERNQVPRQYERVLREYFERLAGLAGKKAGDKAKSDVKDEAKPEAGEKPAADDAGADESPAD